MSDRAPRSAARPRSIDGVYARLGASPAATDGPAGALARVERLLHIVPRAVRAEGASVTELAAELEVPAEVVVEDLKILAARSYDRPPGFGDDVRIEVDGDRVRAFSTGPLHRPARLSLREALCVGLGLRLASLSSALPDGGRREALRGRIEDRLASASPGPLLERFAAPELDEDPSGARRAVLEAYRKRTPCRLTYLKPGAPGPEERRVRPYAVAHAEGRWYVVGHCESAGRVRTFRVDRIVSASPMDGRFTVPEEFDAEAFVSGGRVFTAADTVEAHVRYSPEIARWLAERHEGQWELDGSFVARHRVADPAWIVGHVLSYGGEAELADPPDLRALVRDAALRMTGGETA